ncbi:MAG: hypothetical protein HY064_14555 [Bacteroidetes bacterium]|nr:hypothetical protein [Bacteroidota bacterium]
MKTKNFNGIATVLLLLSFCQCHMRPSEDKSLLACIRIFQKNKSDYEKVVSLAHTQKPEQLYSTGCVAPYFLLFPDSMQFHPPGVDKIGRDADQTDIIFNLDSLTSYSNMEGEIHYGIMFKDSLGSIIEYHASQYENTYSAMPNGYGKALDNYTYKKIEGNWYAYRHSCISLISNN